MTDLDIELVKKTYPNMLNAKLTRSKNGVVASIANTDGSMPTMKLIADPGTFLGSKGEVSEWHAL